MGLALGDALGDADVLVEKFSKKKDPEDRSTRLCSLLAFARGFSTKN